MAFRWALSSLLLGTVLSIGYSLRLIRLGKREGASEEALLKRRRETGLLIFGVALAGAYTLSVLFLTIFWTGLTVALPGALLVHLLGWSLPRLFITLN